jgi:dihydroorotase
MIVPCLVDCHVHFREPGLTHKGDLLTESQAAHAGGVAVVCEMPNTIPPTQTIEALRDKVDRSKRCEGFCDVRFFFGATDDSHLSQLRELWQNPDLATLKTRCSGLKLYLDNSTGDLKAEESVTRNAFRMCAELGITLVAHCEDTETNSRCCDHVPYSGPSSHSERRPPISEEKSVKFAIGLARENGTRLHIAHLSTRGGLSAVKSAKSEGLPVTCEVTPHHLFLTTDDYPTGGAHIKVNPPMRDVVNRDALWAGLCDGSIDCVGTDHAPHTAEEKSVTENPPSGIPGVELVVSLMMSACSGHWPHPTAPPPPGWPFKEIGDHVFCLTKWMHTNPNIIFGLNLDQSPTAELHVDELRIVRGAELHSKVKWTPYEGWVLKGTSTFFPK